MAQYTVTIRKTFPERSESWSNVYHVNAVDIDAGAAIAEDIAVVEQAIHYVCVDFTTYTIKGAAGAGIQRNLGFSGSRALPGGGIDDLLPLWNVALVKFQPAEGRMSPKYLRLPLAEDEVSGGNLSSTLQTSIQDDYAGPLMLLAGVTDEDGQPFETFVIQAAVQMRQLRWNRRVRPGYHRGWVPD